jgi:thiol-disulfide isomerase/thioredoxin
MIKLLFTGFCLLPFILFSQIIPDVGQIAPEIKLKGLKGNEIALTSLRGNYVLIDFWASWCKDCRASNPKLVKLFNEYKSKKFKKTRGFVIFSVSLDKNMTDWVNGIKKDGLIWVNHVSEFKTWKSQPVIDYGIESIPAYILLDQNGAILIRTENIDDIKAELMKLAK